MATCKNCGTEIKDGDLCESCKLLLGTFDESEVFNETTATDVDEDLMELLGMIDFNNEKNEEPQEDLNDIDIDSLYGTTKEKDEKGISDVSDVFSDALGVLNDNSDLGNDDLFDLIPDRSETKEEVPKKKSLLAKWFGNVPDEKEKNEEHKKSEEKEEESKEEDAEDVKKKTKKSKAEKKAEKLAKQKEKKEKKVKKSKKEEKEEKEAATPVIELDTGRINRVGAAIVFLVFGVFSAFVILGTNSFAYAHSVGNASEYFEKQKYTKAYDEISGLNIKQSDQEIYDKIVTVMYVNKQLNSYNNYYSIEMYPEALDSLLKGLEKYSAYIERAKELGVKSDLDYVKKQITSELKNQFNIEAEEAEKINSISSQEEYSKKVIQLAK
ncbi:hypothetical protein [Anaeromicropila populeti]|uniref:Uncharacterized protein n=1 Tax=Anaeromicropila populeti TaxID=37658 RepID=A0A1I6LPR6_9FIRM|nr:hypothetical protein [Anaeromicropila populeti]SFS05497.1 hypothetical protein SAMN05661086_03485 [Anaeromicropila populeti]